MLRALIAAVTFAITLALVPAAQPPQVGETKEGGGFLPTYQSIRPAGESLAFNGRPVDLALALNGKVVYLKD
jgi:hypothetical protein